MTTGELQQELFEAIKKKMGENTVAAEQIARVLDISTDSAYRRMRGEKTVTLKELQTLSSHYQVSLDQLMRIQAKGIVFQGQYLDKNNFRFEEYMTNMLNNMIYMNSFKEKYLFYLCKDLPIFHQYGILAFNANTFHVTKRFVQRNENLRFFFGRHFFKIF